jgi:nucleotide-binding universal stress UspA family protein
MVLLHVDQAVVGGLPAARSGSDSERAARASADCEARLADARQQAVMEGATDVETKLVRGGVSKEILSCAGQFACDLIVMGSHERSGFSRTLGGSVAQDVIRGAHCPVLAVRTTPSADVVHSRIT